MEIKEARFIISNTDFEKCPHPNKPEYAFTGRSNVGKSSLINALTNRKSLAKTSGKPGKTRLINHYLINGEWFLVDLPGYGYATIAMQERKKWEKIYRDYILFRKNLYCLFVLIDSRHEPQAIDLRFLEFLGLHKVPIALVFTKADKLKPAELEKNIKNYQKKLLETWETLPPWFVSSAKTGEGRSEILDFIENTNQKSKISDQEKAI